MLISNFRSICQNTSCVLAFTVAFLLISASNVVFSQISTTPNNYPYPAVNFVYTQNFSTLPTASGYVSGISAKGPYYLGSIHPGLSGLFIAQTNGSNSALNFNTSSGTNATAAFLVTDLQMGPQMLLSEV